MNKKIVKCRYPKCLHSCREVPIEDAVLHGKGTYFHPDCLEEMENLKEVIDLFAKEINPNVVFSQLRAVISDIVYKKKVESGLLLYGVKHYIKNNIPLHYPQGLYYVIQNVDVQRLYAERKQKQSKTTVEVDNTETTFTYKPQKPKTIADLVV